MIYITKGQANTCVFTFNEKATTTTYDVLFKFTNEITGESKLFTGFDLSTNRTRYNEFVITESTTENVYNSTIELTPTGYWTYIAYQMADTSPTSLNPANAVGTLEIGKVYVYDSTENVNYTFTDDEDKNNKVFEG
jgi:hypothetical protein